MQSPNLTPLLLPLPLQSHPSVRPHFCHLVVGRCDFQAALEDAFCSVQECTLRECHGNGNSFWTNNGNGNNDMRMGLARCMCLKKEFPFVITLRTVAITLKSSIT